MASVDSSLNPYSTPQSSVTAPDDGRYGSVKILSLRSRLGRLRYFSWYFGVSLLIFAAYSIIAGAAFGANQFAGGGDALAAPIGAGVAALNVVMMLITIPLTIVLTVQRLHDIDASGWWTLAMLVPLANLALLLIVLFKRGTPGPNRFGLPPPPNSAAVKIFAALVTALFVLMLAVTLVGGWYLLQSGQGF